MIKLEVTVDELEALNNAIVLLRVCGDYTKPSILPDLHLKLENLLELYTKGGEIELPIPERLRTLGVTRHVKVIPPRNPDD